jgi:hypothetical protein
MNTQGEYTQNQTQVMRLWNSDIFCDEKMDTSDELQRLRLSVMTTDSRNHWTCLHKLNNTKSVLPLAKFFYISHIWDKCEINNILHNEILTADFSNSINMDGILFYISKDV